MSSLQKSIDLKLVPQDEDGGDRADSSRGETSSAETAPVTPGVTSEGPRDDHAVLCNYCTGDGDKFPMRIEEIRRWLGDVMPGWPKRVGEKQLFIRTKLHRAIYLDSPARLFAWLDGLARVTWMIGPEYVSQARFYEYLTMIAERYQAIETLPHWPAVPGIYYMHPPVGEPAGLLDELIGFFSASQIDRQLIKAFVLTLFWGGPPGKRPAFLFEGPENDPERGRGVGKTTLVDVISQELADGSINVSARETMADIKTRMLTSDEGRKRLVRLDNVKTLRLSWDELENEITSPVISGKALYRGEGRRPNLSLWAITLNGAALSKDMALRVIPVRLERPRYQAGWEEMVRQFIRSNRPGLLGDIRRILESEPGDLKTGSRWGDWERAILSKLRHPRWLQAEIRRRQKEVDTDDDESETYKDLIIERFKLYGLDPDLEAILIPSSILAAWINEQLPAGKRLAVNQASAFVKTLGIANLRKSDRQGNRGWLWIGDKVPSNHVVKDLPTAPGLGSGGSDVVMPPELMHELHKSLHELKDTANG